FRGDLSCESARLSAVCLVCARRGPALYLDHLHEIFQTMIDLPPDRNTGPRFAEFAHPEAAQPASSIQRRKSAGRETAAFGWESVPSQDRGADAGSSLSSLPGMGEKKQIVWLNVNILCKVPGVHHLLYV